MSDQTVNIQQSVVDAIHSRTPLILRAGGSKDFLGRQAQGQVLSLKHHRGIVSYQPTELVLTARAGTPLSEIEVVLAESGQMLPFEPPHFADDATFGGTVASGLSGPIRPYTGRVRDFVLGCKILNGHGEVLQFGGQVMKNVAGYDVSRLMVGAMGTLGLLLEISIKVLPAFPEQVCLSQARNSADAFRFMRTLSAQNLPLTGLAYDGENVHIRLAGAKAAVTAASKKLGGEQTRQEQFWQLMNEHKHTFFSGDKPLWRLSLPPAARPIDISDRQLIDWGGGLRWLRSDEPSQTLFRLADDLGGHAQLFRGGDRQQERMQPLPAGMMALHQRLKHSFDPHAIFNPGRLYQAF